MNRATKVALFILLGLGVAGALLISARVRARGRYVAAYSTYGSGPEGTRGAFLLAESRAHEPERWVEDLSGLPEGGMLLALGGCESARRPLGRLERERLVRWVEAGGVLVVAGASGYLEGFPVRLQTDDERCDADPGVVGALRRLQGEQSPQKDTIVEEPEPDFGDAVVEDLEETREPAPRLVVGSHGALETMPAIGMRIRSEIDVDANTEHDTLLRLGGPNGRAVGVRIQRGRGMILVLASGSPFQNRDLAEQGGGMLLARLIGEYGAGRRVLFDEYHLGIGAQRSLVEVITQLGGGAFVVQLLFLVLIALYRSGSRFGSVREAGAMRPVGTASYVEGIGALYKQAADRGGAAAILLRRALRRLALHHHLGPSSIERIAEVLDGSGREALAARLRKVSSSSQEPLGVASFAGELDRVVEEILADERGRPPR